MLAIVCLSMEAFSQPESLATLADMAREYELVLVCPHHAAVPGPVSTLRSSLSGHVVIAVVIDGVACPQERELIEGILNDGHIPLIVTTRNPAWAGVTDWIYTDIAVSLPDDVHAIGRGSAALI